MPWAPDYVSADEVAAFAHVDDDVDDVDYGRCATTASRAVDYVCHRQFGRTASESRLYTPEWSYTYGAWIVPVDDLVVLTSVSVDALGAWDYTSSITIGLVRKLGEKDANAEQEGRPWTALAIRNENMPSFKYARDCVRVTGEFGWASVPVAVKEAALLQASRFAARRDSPLGVAGSPDAGSEIRLLERLDPDVKMSIKDYIRRVLP